MSNSTFNPYGFIMFILNIQWVLLRETSLCRYEFLQFCSTLSMAQNLWYCGSQLCLILKCCETLWYLNPFFMFRICSLILIDHFLVVLPTYCSPQLHSSAYVTCVLQHVISLFCIFAWLYLIGVLMFFLAPFFVVPQGWVQCSISPL